VDEALRSGKALAGKLGKLRKAVQIGDLREIDKGLAEARELAPRAQTQAGSLSVEIEDDYFPERFLEEFRAAAETAGLSIKILDGKIYCYPLLVRVRAAERSVQVGARQERGVRPSALIARLRSLQGKPQRLESQGFLNLLHKAYTYCLSGKASGVVALGKIYEILTPMPGVAKECTRDDFARQLYLLDQTPGAATRSGHTAVLSASTGTRHGGEVFLTIGENGAEKRYYGIAFHKNETAS
jgi:hypothetical protein